MPPDRGASPGRAASRAYPPWLKVGDDFVSAQILVRPGASRRGVVRREPRGLVVGVNSQPEKGRANHELIAYLADLLDIPRTAVSILRGDTARLKTVRITTGDPVRIAAILAGYSGD